MKQKHFAIVPEDVMKIDGIPLAGFKLYVAYIRFRDNETGLAWPSAGTLAEIRASDLPAKVARIEQTILTCLNDLGEMDVALRGKGAAWILELPTSMSVPDVMARILRGGVIVSPTANFVRLLPAATISLAHLTEACGVIQQACQAQSGTGR